MNFLSSFRRRSLTFLASDLGELCLGFWVGSHFFSALACSSLGAMHEGFCLPSVASHKRLKSCGTEHFSPKDSFIANRAVMGMDWYDSKSRLDICFCYKTTCPLLFHDRYGIIDRRIVNRRTVLGNKIINR